MKPYIVDNQRALKNFSIVKTRRTPRIDDTKTRRTLFMYCVSVDM